MQIRVLLFALIAISATAGHALTGKFQLSTSSGDITETIEFFDDLSLVADTLVAKGCTGRYIYSWDGYLEITYNGPDGEDSLGGCHNASSNIDLGEVKLEQIDTGVDFIVITRAIMNDGNPKNLVMKKL